MQQLCVRVSKICLLVGDEGSFERSTCSRHLRTRRLASVSTTAGTMGNLLSELRQHKAAKNPLTSCRNGEKLQKSNVREGRDSPNKLSLKNMGPCISQVQPPRSSLFFVRRYDVHSLLAPGFLILLVCAGSLPLQSQNHSRVQITLAYSVDIGTSPSLAPQSASVPIAELMDSANAGDALAQNNLGYLYTLGLEVPLDYEQAARWYARAATQGLAAAEYNLGVLYERGLGVAREFRLAARLYRAAAEQGHVLGESRLAFLNKQGLGIPANLPQAMKWYRAAAEQGDRSAQCNLAQGYFSGVGIPRDLREAAKWFLKAAEEGLPAAQNNLAASYHHGWGLPIDYKQALRWYHAAAEQGLAEAKNSIGVMYQDGLGVERDYAQAANWYQAAAQQGDKVGQYNLATLYAAGLGVPLDYVSAYVWFSLAASSGDEHSARQLKCLTKLMTPRQIERAKTKIAQQQHGDPTSEAESAGLASIPESK
jgi:TPR repeat protein